MFKSSILYDDVNCIKASFDEWSINVKRFAEALQHYNISCFWQPHFAEKDEGKNHFHICFYYDGKSSKAFNFIRDMAKDFGLGCMPLISTSRFDDWYLYAMHNTVYLRSKGLKKEYVDYNIQVIGQSTDSDFWQFLVGQVQLPTDYVLDVIRLLDDGFTFRQICVELALPINVMCNVRALVDLCHKFDGKKGV